MSRDRLAQSSTNPFWTKSSTSSPAIELQSSNPLQTFFDQVEKCNQRISELSAALLPLKRLHAEVATAANTDDIIRKRASVEDYTAQLNAQVRSLTTELQQMRPQPTSNQLSQSDHVVKTQHQNLMQKFAKVMEQYVQLEKESRDAQHIRAVRQYMVVNPMATEEQINEAIENRNDLVPIFAQETLGHMTRQNAMAALDSAQEERSELERLERNIVELSRMYNDLSVLIAAQGEMVDRIEIYVENTSDTATGAVNELKKAVMYQKRNRRRCWCLFWLLIILVIAIAIILYFTLKDLPIWHRRR